MALKPESSAAQLEPTPAASFTGADGALADALRIDGLESARREAATRLQEHSALLSLGLGVLKQEVAALLNDVELHVIVASRASHAEADASSASSTSSSAASAAGGAPRVAPGTNPSAADYLATKRALEKVWARAKALGDDALVNARMRKALGKVLLKLSAVAHSRLTRAEAEAEAAAAALVYAEAAEAETAKAAKASEGSGTRAPCKAEDGAQSAATALHLAALDAEDAEAEVAELRLLLELVLRQREGVRVLQRFRPTVTRS